MDEFKSTDLYESAFLYASGAKLLRLEGQGSQKWFVFEQKEQCEGLINIYWSREATVVAKDFAEGIRSLKDLLFARGR